MITEAMARLIEAEKKTRPAYQAPALWAWRPRGEGQIEIEVFHKNLSRNSSAWLGRGPTHRQAFLNLCESIATVLPPRSNTLDCPEVQEKIERRAAFLEVVAELYAEAGGNWSKP